MSAPKMPEQFDRQLILANYDPFPAVTVNRTPWGDVKLLPPPLLPFSGLFQPPEMEKPEQGPVIDPYDERYYPKWFRDMTYEERKAEMKRVEEEEDERWIKHIEEERIAREEEGRWIAELEAAEREEEREKAEKAAKANEEMTLVSAAKV